jgi:RNA polymerase sigma-70 factor (ECF subfamily)
VGSEEDFIRACARGDAEAWRRFVDLYAGFVLRVVRSTLRRAAGSTSEADAEDVAAEVFRQLVERDRALLRSFRPPFNIRAWLAVLARRNALRVLRRRPHAPIEHEPAAADPPAHALLDLLEKLSTEDRLLLELFFVHDCSYEEISRTLGIPVDTIGKQKFRALEKLKGLAQTHGLENL